MGNANSGTSPRDDAIRVVIVDDDLFVRTALTRLLDRSDGIQVIGSFGDGVQSGPLHGDRSSQHRPDRHLDARG